MTQRNAPERRDMLDARADQQRDRAPGFTPCYRKPPRHIGKTWDSFGEKEAREPVDILPASANRRTGKAHEHRSERARRVLQRVAA